MWHSKNTQRSPHSLADNRTAKVMQYLLLASSPGVIMQILCFGWGSLLQLIWGIAMAVIFECSALKVRGRDFKPYIADYSAVVTGLLLGVAVPPLAPWWFITCGIGFAILAGKHLYGGLGHNLFNPAMLGYAMLLVSFPKQASSWLPALQPDLPYPSFTETLGIFFGYATQTADNFAHATPLDIVKNNKYLTLNELWHANSSFNKIGGSGIVWINFSYALGGLFLLYKRVINWHAPVGMLTSIAVMAFLFWHGGNSSSHASPLFHLFDGATMIGAFFIITDPVSGAASNQGRLIFGVGAGILIYIIRTFGGYPDAIAFATLLMNVATPLLDYYTAPRAYGHKKATRGLPRNKD